MTSASLVSGQRLPDIPDYAPRIPQTFGQQAPNPGTFTNSSKVSSPNKAELLYSDAYALNPVANAKVGTDRKSVYSQERQASTRILEIFIPRARLPEQPPPVDYIDRSAGITQAAPEERQIFFDEPPQYSGAIGSGITYEESADAA